MGLDNKLIFPDFQTLTLDKDNPTAYYTREASGELNRLDGRSEIKVYNRFTNRGGNIYDSDFWDIDMFPQPPFKLLPLNKEGKNTQFQYVFFYDKDKNKLRSADAWTSEFTEEHLADAKYIVARISDNGSNFDIDNQQVLLNGELTYFNRDIVEVGLLNTSTNKYDINITSSKDYTVGNILNKGYPTAIHSTRDYLYVKKIPVTPNKVYSFKRNPFNSQMNIYSFQNNEYGDGTLIKQFYSGYDTGSFTVPNNVEFITIAFLGGKNSIDTCYLQEGDEFVDYVQTSTKTISIEQPLRQANNNVYDSIYRFGDGGYYLFKRVGVRSYQDGDYDNPLVITDGVNTNYDLGIADYTEVQLTDFDPSIDFFGTDTTFSCDSMMPSIEVKVPIDYAYNESKRKYVDEEINIDTVDVDSRKNIEIVSIEGQTYENLLQEPLVQGTAINPVELTGRECVYTGGENTTVPLREITGDTYINLLEDKIKNTTIKPVASYNGDVVDGTLQYITYEDLELVEDMLSPQTGLPMNSPDSSYHYSKLIKINKSGYVGAYAKNRMNLQFYFYREDFSFIKTIFTNSEQSPRVEIPDGAKYVRFYGDYLRPEMKQHWRYFYVSSSYNLGDYDKVTIDEIKGNTKVYHNPIPIADYKTNAFCCDLVLQSIDNDGKQDLSKKEYLGFSNYIYVKDFNKGIYARVYEKGSTVSKGFGATWYRYDDNLKYIGKSGWAIDDSARYMNIPDTSYIKLVLTNNNEVVEHQEGIYDVVISDTMPTGYIEPTILGSKTFPIQSVGELYVDEQGEPVLDSDSKEQYKIDVNSCSFPLSISKNNFIKHLTEGTLIYEFKDNVLKIRNETYYGNCIFKFHRNYIPKQLVDNILISNGRKILYLHVKGKITNLDYPSKKGGFLNIVGSYLNRAGSVYSTTYDTKFFEFDLNLKCEVYTNYDFNNLYFGVDLTDHSGNSNNSNFIHQEVEFYEIGYHYMNVPYKTNTESILSPQPLRSVHAKGYSVSESKLFKDKLYWDLNRKKYCIENNVNYVKLPYSSSWRIEQKNDTSFIITLGNSNTILKDAWRTNNLITGVSNLGLIKYGNIWASFFLESTILRGSSITNENIINLLKDGIEVYYLINEPQIIETNITEKITLPCSDNSTYIYTIGTSSHDEVNLPPIEELKGEITCTTLPLSTTAYIKPNTKYTMFMDTDCKVSYNLGGMEKEYSTQGKILITTPTTLSNNTLTLLGEGNIGNVTLLEGDYTNSYVPDKFINDVFSVGDLQEDGSYKIDIVSKNKNLAVIKNIDFPYTTVPTIVKNNEEKSIELRSSSGRDLLTKTNLNFKAGTTYTLSIKIETNNTNTSARIIVIDDINRQNSLGGNATTVVSIYNPATTKTVTATFTPNVDSCLFLNLNNYANLPSETYVKFSEIIVLEGDFNEQDINYYEGKYEIKPILLPCQLMKVGDICDKFYWDNTKGKMCIEKNIIPINHAIQKEGINLSYIGSGDGCGVIHYNINGISDLKVNSRIICNKFTSFNSKYELLTEGREKGVEGIHSDDGDINTAVFSFNRNRVKNLDINTIAQWFSDNNVIIQYYITSSPKIIETDITEPIEIDIFDTDTTITTTSTVNPNMYLKSDILSRPVTIKPSTKYYVYANTTGDIEVSLGGAKIQYTSNDIVKEITTPSNISKNIIGFVGNCEVSNVMLRTDNRTDIKYFNGVIYASILQDDGNYKTTINIMSNNSEEYDSFINIITSSPLESGSKIVVVDNEFKLLKANGEYEDIVSTDGNVVIDSNCKKICSCGEVNGITSLIVPYRSVRPLKAPINISFNNYADNDNHTFIWDTDVGVEGHKFYYKDELVATIENPDPTYTYPSEMEGDVKIVAFNTLTESQGAVEDIITLPNRSEIVALNTIYDNGYKFTIVFNDNSNIRKGYKFIYSVDDGEENVIDIPVSDKAITLSQSIDVSEVSNNMKVRINSYNSVGEAEMKEKVFYLTPTPKWAYLLSSDNLMFRHQDKFPFTTYYKIKATNTQTLEEKEYNYGSNQGINGLIIDYLLKSNREEELSIMLTMNDGYLDHVPCVPFKVSKTLDLSLVAPQNFTMEWVGDGVAKFSWDDNYTNEDYFEFVYSLNGGIEEVVRIYPEDVAGTGGRISYTYEFDGFGILTGRVRMVWELNTSEYTDSKTATFVAVTGLPPAWIVKEYSGDNLVITWEAQSYVDHYEIMIECDGEVEILTEKKDMFYLDLKKYHGKYVSISIKTHFTTGLVTEYSDSILFKPVSTSGITNQMTYAPIKVEKDDNVSVYTKLADRYTSYQRITGLITNSNLLYNKFCKDMLTNSASFNNVFYHLVNHEYKDFVSVKTDNVSIESLIRILNYAHINQDGHLNTFVYTPITSSHTDFVDIQKVTIVCIGDSITSGHPGFWE